MDRSNKNVSKVSHRGNVKKSLPNSQREQSKNLSKDNKELQGDRDNEINDKLGLLNQFIFKYEIEGWLLMLFRFLIYMLLAIDCWNEIPRSAKYWKLTTFNISHFGLFSLLENWLQESYQLPLINDTSFLIGIIFCGVLAVRCSFGLNSNRLEPLLIVLTKSYLVFSSQLDNYQHHYLLVLVFLVMATIDWNSFGKLEIQKKYSVWQIRVLLLQLSVVYFWTLITKLDESWLNGTVLPQMVGPEFMEKAYHFLGEQCMVIVSNATVLSELFLLFAIHIPRLHPAAFIIGFTMHFIMGSSGLLIGTFSYFMMVFYMLLIPIQLKVHLKTVVAMIIEFLSTTSNQLSPKSKALEILFSIGAVLLSKLLLLKTIPEQFQYSFNIAFYSVIIYSVLSSFPYLKSRHFQVLLLSTLLIVLASKSTHHLRTTYTERGSLAISIRNYDSAIENYIIAEQISDENEFKFVKQNSNDFEFIGDLGLFLESKNQTQEAYSLYSKYVKIYPNLLKLHAGILRCQATNGLKKEICLNLPNARYLSKQITKEPCFDVSCERSKKHAYYVLDLCEQLSNQFCQQQQTPK
eukprot:gene7578-9317_t